MKKTQKDDSIFNSEIYFRYQLPVIMGNKERKNYFLWHISKNSIIIVLAMMGTSFEFLFIYLYYALVFRCTKLNADAESKSSENFAIKYFIHLWNSTDHDKRKKEKKNTIKMGVQKVLTNTFSLSQYKNYMQYTDLQIFQ